MSSERIQLLDHGYIFEVEHWGSDERIVEAARMSTNKGFLGWGPIMKCKHCDLVEHPNKSGEVHPYQTVAQMGCSHELETNPGDEKLLRYLYTKNHSTPFEMAGLVIEVQCPIFVLRQWHRHRTQSYNELSARYTAIDNLNYVPTVDRCIVVPSTNKQSRGIGDRVPTHAEVLTFLEMLSNSYEVSEAAYQYGLGVGIPKELSRLPVPVGRYSRMRASTNLRNWLGFMTLRSDSHAQEEIRVFSDAIGTFVKARFPRTWELFVEGQHRGN